MNILYFSLSFSVILITHLNSNAVIEYYNLFKLKGVKWLDGYNEYSKSGFVENLVPYLIKKYPNDFLIKLLTCPTCLSVWIGIFSIPFTGFKFLMVSFLTLFFYHILRILSEYASE